MTEEQLIYYTTIVELGSFSEAALELNISQSSISKQIMQLESELGIALFDRSSRKASLTQAGERLYPDAVSALNQIKTFKKAADLIRLGDKTRINILVLPIIGHFNFYVPIHVFQSEHMDCEVNLIEMEEVEMDRRIASGDFDIALTYFSPNHISPEMEFTPVLQDEFLLAATDSSPLSHNTAITPEMLNGAEVMAMQKYTCVNQFYELYFKKFNVVPRVMFRGRPETILSATLAGRGVSLVSKVNSGMFNVGDLKFIPFNPPLKAQIGVIINPDHVDEPLYQELIRKLSNF